MPLLGARAKNPLLKGDASKWGAEEAGDASVKKRPANESVFRRPSAKRPASVFKRPSATRRDRKKDGWLKRNIKSLPEGVIATIETAAPGQRTQITNAIVEKIGDGSWKFNLEHPTIQEILRKTEGSYYERGQKGVPFEIAKNKNRLC